MKLLFLTNKVPYPPKDGGSIASLGMMKTFALLGHQVTVLTMNTLKHHVEMDEIPSDIQQLMKLHLVKVDAPIRKTQLVINLLTSNKPYNAVRFIDEGFRKKLIEILLHDQFDVIQLEGLYVCPYIETIRKYSKGIIAYRSHNVEHEIWQRTAQASKGLKRFYFNSLASRIKKMELDLLNQYDVLVPITERDGHLYTLMGNKKPTMAIPAGVEIPETLNSSIIPQNNLFFIGALDWTPNQEGLNWFFENCWPAIKAMQPNIQLAIAGRNAPDWMVENIKNSGSTYYGEVENAHQFMLENGIMIAPLLSGGGMRVKIIEGMALGKPIVTSIVGCEGINASHGDHIMISKNADEFVSNTIDLLTNQELQEKLSSNSREFVNEFYTNNALTRKLANFYTNYSNK